MTSSSKTAKTRKTPLGKRNAAATKPKKARTCGYFDCAGCDACKHVSADRVAARHPAGDSSGCLPAHSESPGAAARPATCGVTVPGHQTFCTPESST